MTAINTLGIVQLTYNYLYSVSVSIYNHTAESYTLNKIIVEIASNNSIMYRNGMHIIYILDNFVPLYLYLTPRILPRKSLMWSGRTEWSKSFQPYIHTENYTKGGSFLHKRLLSHQVLHPSGASNVSPTGILTPPGPSQ